jgi:hypothetical protein
MRAGCCEYAVCGPGVRWGFVACGNFRRHNGYLNVRL